MLSKIPKQDDKLKCVKAILTDFENCESWDTMLEEAWATGQYRFIAGQLELCPTTSREHLQAFIQLRASARYSTIKSHFGSQTLHVKPVGRDYGASDYGNKEDTRIEGPVEYGVRPNLDNPNDHKTFRVKDLETLTSDAIINMSLYQYCQYIKAKYLRERELKKSIPYPYVYLKNGYYNWQIKILEIIKEEADDRSIIWIWEPIGNTGKSTFLRHILGLYQKEAFYFTEAKSADIKYAYNGERIILCDLARDQSERVPYGTIECLKNGTYFSSKYESEMRVYGGNRHIIVCANFMANQPITTTTYDYQEKKYIQNIKENVKLSVDRIVEFNLSLYNL